MQILEVFKVTFYFEKLGISTFCKKKNTRKSYVVKTLVDGVLVLVASPKGSVYTLYSRTPSLFSLGVFDTETKV